MPYKTTAELPASVKDHLPAKAQRMFMHVVNTQEERGLSTERAFASAWAQIKEHYTKDPDTGQWHEIEKAALTMPITKIDTAQRKVFGFASVAKLADGSDLIDRQGDVLHSPSMQSAVYHYVLDSRDGGEMHTRRGVAKLCESVYFTTEKLAAMGLPADAIPESWWVGFQVDDDDVWQGVTSGKYAAFSIAGLGSREEYEEGS